MFERFMGGLCSRWNTAFTLRSISGNEVSTFHLNVGQYSQEDLFDSILDKNDASLRYLRPIPSTLRPHFCKIMGPGHETFDSVSVSRGKVQFYLEGCLVAQSDRLDLNVVHVHHPRRDDLLAFISNQFEPRPFLRELTMNDRPLVEDLLEFRPRIIRYLSDELLQDIDLILLALSIDGLQLEYLAVDLRARFDVVGEAVRNNGLALRYASPALRNNHQIVSWAVSDEGLALQYASNGLKHDRGIISSAVNNNHFAARFVPEPIRNTLWFAVLMQAHIWADIWSR